MATNELAAILARRRAKEGGADAAPAFESSAPDANGAPATPAAPSAQRSSIADRIARLKQQSAAAGPAPVPVPIAASRPPHPGASASETPPPAAPSPAPSPWAASTPTWSNSASGESTTESAPADTPAAADTSAPGNRRTSGRIAQLQGSLGINVNPFRAGGPPGGFRKPSGGHRVEGDGSEGTERSIMTTGDQYAHMHGTMGIRMPGMGAAVPMPGLAKAGARIPGMAPSAETAEEEDAAAAASLEASHTTMSRVTGPKRRGPTRPPPGAFRLPGAAAPIPSPVEPAEQATTEAAPATPAPVVSAAPSEGLFGVPAPAIETPSADLFGGSHAISTGPHTAPPPTPVFEVAKPAATLVQPVATLVQPEPAPVLFSSEPSVVASLGSLSVSDAPSASSTPLSQPESSTSLFGNTSSFSAAPVATTTPIVPTAPAPQPVAASPPATAPMARKASLFGSASMANDDDSDSDWSDDDSAKPKPSTSLFGAAPAPTPAIATPPPAASTPTIAPPAQTSGGLFGGGDDHDSLFGGPLPTPTAPAPAAAVHANTSTPAPAPTPAAPSSTPAPVAAPASSSLFGPPAGAPAAVRPPQQYTSLFGPDDDESDESDDEGGLFGTGLPTSR